MSGTISPGRLLSTLKILLSPNGGIKSRGEVERLVSLMQKFSRKLVSKVIYIHILKSSTPPLLEAFFAESGWSLLSSWLSSAISSANRSLCSELLQLLVLCSPPPHPLQQDVLSLLQTLQLQTSRQTDALFVLVDQVTFKWSHPSETTTLNPPPIFKSKPLALQLSPQSVVSSVSSSVLPENPMTPSRRWKKTVIVTNPTMVGHSSASAAEKVVMTVTYQEKPLQNIMDVFKYQRRKYAEDIETQAWQRDGGGRKRISERITVPNKGARNCFKSSRRTSPMPPLMGRFQSEVPTSEEELEDDDPIFVSKIVSRPRRRLVDSTSVHVSLVTDQDTTSMKDLHMPNEGVDADVEDSNNPLKIFEEISNELKENLLLEKHIALNQESRRGGSVVRGREGNVWGWNNNTQASGVEGSAKDFRLARREKFREEQKLLEEHNEAHEREEREKKRERIKNAKREVDRKTKELKEKDERIRKIEIEDEERKKREKIEEEFKKRREEERLKRQERKRQEKNLGSFKKSEIKNGLNNEEKLKIKLIAQQMKRSSDILEATSSTSFQGRIPKLPKNDASDQGESASKPSKPLFSTAKNKNRDLLASLEDPIKPSKKPIALAKDNFVQKKPIILKTRPESVDYGVILPVVDVANKIPRKKEENQNDEVIAAEIAAESVDKVSQPEDIKPGIAAVHSLNSRKLKERVSSSINEENQDDKVGKVNKSREEVESRSKPKSPKERDIIVKNKEIKKVESKESHPNVKSSRNVTSSKGGEKVLVKSGLSLKPVSQLKESSLFGDLLENVEKSAAKKRKMSSIEEYKKRSKHSKSAEKKADGKSITKSTSVEPVAIVPRKVSGILIVERGTESNKKFIKWREDENLVQVEYFTVDIAERVNVHKLKFEEVSRQEREKERSLLSTRHNTPEKDVDEDPLLGLKLLTNCGRTNFKSGSKSQEKEFQRLREESVLPSVSFGEAPSNPSEPDVTQNRNLFAVGTTRDFLADDVSGEGTEVDYSGVGWPAPLGSVLSYDDGIGASQFCGASELYRDGDSDLGIEVSLGKAVQRHPTNPISRGFGRGAAATQQVRGFRGGFDARGRGGFGGKKRMPCMYWRRGNCRDGQTCKFLHL